MKALQLIVALAFLVVIHEFGHYIFARIFGIKVEKFYLFFNPWFTLFKWQPKPKPDTKPGTTSWRDTEYGIGWLPLGGYCKIAGMIDESMDTEQLAQEPQPWEFRTKPAWQRLFVMVGGVLFNFILAIIIYAGIAFCWGDKYIPFHAVTEGFDYSPAALEAGFKPGDIPIAADGEKLDASQPDALFRIVEAKNVTVRRNMLDTVSIAIPDDMILRVNDDKWFMRMRVPVIIDRLVPGEAAAKSGMKEGDRIIAVNSTLTPSYTELAPALEATAGKEAQITVKRDGRKVVIKATPNEFGKLGFQLRAPSDIYQTINVEYGFFESFPKGWEIGTTTLTNYVTSLRHVFTRDGAQSIGGFGALGNMFPERWNWYSFWSITAFLSVALAFMNILPIPGLDGGHIMFLLYEIIARRKPSENFLVAAQYVGMAFLLLLLIYANGNDIIRALK